MKLDTGEKTFIKNLYRIIEEEIKEEDIKHCIVTSGFSDWGMTKPIDVHEIIIETLELNTELKDRNGKEIWTNDVLEFKGIDGSFKVKWELGQFIATDEKMELDIICSQSFSIGEVV